MRLEKILVPVDGSPLAERILVHANRLILTTRAEVVLVRVIERGAGEAARLQLDGLRLSLAERNVRASTRVVTSDDAAAAILHVAEEVEPSLIALSTHGRTGCLLETRVFAEEGARLNALNIRVIRVDSQIEQRDLHSSSPNDGATLQMRIAVGRRN